MLYNAHCMPAVISMQVKVRVAHKGQCRISSWQHRLLLMLTMSACILPFNQPLPFFVNYHTSIHCLTHVQNLWSYGWNSCWDLLAAPHLRAQPLPLASHVMSKTMQQWEKNRALSRVITESEWKPGRGSAKLIVRRPDVLVLTLVACLTMYRLWHNSIPEVACPTSGDVSSPNVTFGQVLTPECARTIKVAIACRLATTNRTPPNKSLNATTGKTLP